MKYKKHPLTLLEIMVVISLIAIISGVIGYNLKGSLDEGKAKKTDLAIDKVRDILELELATNDEVSLEKIIDNPEKVLKGSCLVKEPGKLLKDGWGNPLQITVRNQKIMVKSDALEKYREKQNRNRS